MQKEKEGGKGNAGKNIQYFAWGVFFLGILFGFTAAYLAVFARSDIGIFYIVGATPAVGLA